MNELGVKNLVIVDERVATAGQLTPAQFDAMAGAGYRHLISLREKRELQAGWEEERAQQAGVDFVRIEVGGAGDLDEAHARQLGEALARAGEATLVYCRSGQRAGALLALERHFVGGLAPSEALAIGRKAGMGGAEPAVRKVMGLPASD